MTQADYREAIAFIRKGREMASVTSTKARTTKAAAKAKPNSEDLLSELDGL